ncbi:MAG: hypothetical protein Q8T08_00495, partial [Ignavibacteria bacterium]|nr:hypothetical protein [Ignavibacteria bacterium]
YMIEQKNTIKEEQSNEQKTHGFISFFKWFAKNRKMQFLLLFLIFALPIAIIIWGVVLPISTFEPLSSKDTKIDTISTEVKKLDSEQKTALHNILLKEQELQFQQNRLLLAKQDSIYMIVDLSDSLVSLEIKGLKVKSCKIHSYVLTNHIAAAQYENLRQWMKAPFTLKGELATIPKVPVLFIDAPKDTAEAARLPRKPLEPENDIVNFTLLFSNRLALQVEQFEPPLPEDLEKLTIYQKQNDSVFSRNIFNKLIDPLPENQAIRLKIVLNSAEARAIYRAIPHSNSAKMLLKL